MGKHNGSALVAYALILALLAIILIGALNWQGKWVGGIFGEVNSGIEVQP